METEHKELHSALRRRDMPSIDQLLASGMKPCLVEDDFNCFHLAMHSVDYLALDKLLKIEPAGVNSRDPQGNTMLMKTNDMDWVELLVKHKADASLCNSVGDNAFHNAIRNPHPIRLRGGFINFMLNNSSHVDINAENFDGRTIMDLAGDKPQEWAHYFQDFLEAGAKIPEADENGIPYLLKMVPLENSIRKKIIETFIQRGADVNVKDRDGHNMIYHIFIEIQNIVRKADGTSIASTFQTIFLLMDAGCQLQGLDTIYEARFSTPYLKLGTNYQMDAISLLCTENGIPKVQLLRFLREAVIQGHSLKPADSKLLSPLTTLLVARVEETTPDILAMVKLFLQQGVDTTQRILKFEDDDLQMWSDHVDLPDVLVFSLPRKVHSCCRTRAPQPPRSSTCYLSFRHVEREGRHVLKLLMQNWPYQPVALMIFLLDKSIWTGAIITDSTLTSMLDYLAHLGGTVLTNSVLHIAIEERLQAIVATNAAFQKMLTQFSLRHVVTPIVPSLQQLCRNRIRAHLAGRNLGKRLAKLQVWSHGEWRPIPKDIKNILLSGFK